MSDNTPKRHGLLAVKTFFRCCYSFLVCRSGSSFHQSWSLTHHWNLSSVISGFFCLFVLFSWTIQPTHLPRLHNNQIIFAMFSIFTETITRGNSVVDKGNHRRSGKVNLLLGLERFVRGYWETPNKLWKPHCDRRLRNPKENKNRCASRELSSSETVEEKLSQIFTTFGTLLLQHKIHSSIQFVKTINFLLCFNHHECQTLQNILVSFRLFKSFRFI